MTTATLPTVGTLDHPVQTIDLGIEYDVLPDGSNPLRYWRTAYGRLEQHSNYTGTHRPTRVRVRRVERNGSRDANVEVVFRDPRIGEVRTWVHHSFLVPVGTAVATGEVTVAQKAQWVTDFMADSIMDEEWGGAGEPSGWSDADWQRWAMAGNTAVLTRRADIENGSVTAGRVWCEAASAAQSFHYDDDTEDFLHGWFRDNREAIDRGLATLVPEPGQNLAVTDPNLARRLVQGDLVALNGTLYRVERDQTTDDVTLWTYEGMTRLPSFVVARTGVVWMEPGVARLRRRANRSTYGEIAVAGREYVFDRVYSERDKAIYIREVGATRHMGYMCQSDFEPILPPAAPRRDPGAGRVLRTKQTVFLPDNRVGLVLAEDNHDESQRHPGRVKVYTRSGGSWSDSPYPLAEVNFAQEGDSIENDGLVGTFVRNVSDTDIAVMVNGSEAHWARQSLRYTGVPATVREPTPNPVVVVDGVEYVRKDVVDKDIETMVRVLHKGSVEHSLCGVYDRVTAEADRRTDYIKMGPRYRTYDVVVEQTFTVRRTFRVENVVDEDTARAQARTTAGNYNPTMAAAERRTERSAPVIRTSTLTDWTGPATVVG